MRDEQSWTITFENPSGEALGRQESLLSLGNGYLGFRGFYPEGEPVFHAGVFINGFYDTAPIIYGEKAYGYPEYSQSMIDLPDARFLQLRIDGEIVSLNRGRVISHVFRLSMKEGMVTRELEWESSTGKRVRISWEFLVSHELQHAASMRVNVEALSSAEIELVSRIAPSAPRSYDAADPRVRASEHRRDLSCFETDADHMCAGRFATESSGLLLYCGAVHTEVSGAQDIYSTEGETGCTTVVVPAEPGKSLSLTKHMIYHHCSQSQQHEAAEDFQKMMRHMDTVSFEQLRMQNTKVLDDLWHTSSVEIQSDRHLELALRFNMFQLFQSAGRDGRTSLAAKGLTGSGYEGHYFWDTEIYGMPFFTFTRPEIARALLSYRISLLPKARKRAQTLSGKGILFPWRTINGDEASAYFPAGTAQYHINADIVYALMLYVNVTGDESIMDAGGAEILIESARFYYDLGFFNPRRNGAFCIHEVTGPDEYSALVNNNYYTNIMAAYNLHQAAEYSRTHAGSPLLEKLAVTDEEASGWARAAALMYVPYDSQLGIHAQDDQFLDREKWDFENCPKKNYPLLLHFHPLVIYRHQVIKQADVVLAHLLRPDAARWYEKRRDYLYYEQLTTGDSSLSACIQGIIALEIGELDRGIEYLRKTALMDIDDYQGNVRDGLHTAAMGGSWLALVYGAAGLRVTDDTFRFAPITHKRLSSYRFRLTIRKSIIEVSIHDTQAAYRLMSGTAVHLYHYGRLVELSRETPEVELSLYPEFSAAIFDLDGVITSTDHQHYLAWKQLSDELSMDFDEELNRQLRGVSRRESLEIIAGHNNRTFSPEQIQEYTDRKNGYYRKLLESLEPDAVLPGFVELCSQLREHNIKIGVASASRNASFILGKLGIRDFIDALVPAAEVAVGKPDPEVFVRCADLLGVERRGCIGFEDALVGVEAIQAAGMKCVAVGEVVKDTQSDMHVNGLAGLSFEKLRALFP
jgi:alpha,alpha-trehalose phosphorylase